MFNGVQKKLTILYTLTTGAILIVLLGCIFLWNITRKEQEEEKAFQTLWISVSAHLQMDPVFSDAYLASTEISSRSVIHIEENGVPLLFVGRYPSKTPRGRLIELAVETAAGEGVSPGTAPVSSSMSQTSAFQIKGDAGDSYRGRLLTLATVSGVKSLLLLTYITPRQELLLQSAPLFFLTCAAGLLCIFAVSWFFTGWSLKPAREGAKKQADFIAAASHELRSPLAVIRSGTAALEDTAKGNPDAEKTLSAIDRECSRMARLVSDMLLLASSDAKTWSLRLSEVETETLLIETYETFLPICREKGLQLYLEIPDNPLPPVRADRQRLEQVLTILMDNAVSYTPRGKAVTLKCDTDSASRKHVNSNKKTSGAGRGYLILEVMDRGPGIPDGQKQRVFDRFYRADASRSDKSHFGLGLSIAKELVEIHGGSILVLDREGGGSRFVVRLPGRPYAI